jgi:hypothetical protein
MTCIRAVAAIKQHKYDIKPQMGNKLLLYWVCNLSALLTHQLLPSLAAAAQDLTTATLLPAEQCPAHLQKAADTAHMYKQDIDQQQQCFAKILGIYINSCGTSCCPVGSTSKESSTAAS